MSKYYPLRQYLEASKKGEEILTYSQIEAILDLDLPPSAYSYQSWWTNSTSHPMAVEWLAAGWEVRGVVLGRVVRFIRNARPMNTHGHTIKYSLREIDFEHYMINAEGKAQTTAYQYRKAINRISKHLSGRMGQSIDIYKISDTISLKEILWEYQNNGWFYDFGTAALVCKQALVKYIRFAIERQRTSSQTGRERDRGTQNPSHPAPEENLTAKQQRAEDLVKIAMERKEVALGLKTERERSYDIPQKKTATYKDYGINTWYRVLKKSSANSKKVQAADLTVGQYLMLEKSVIVYEGYDI